VTRTDRPLGGAEPAYIVARVKEVHESKEAVRERERENERRNTGVRAVVT
jgi:hypothetical protein